MVAAKAAARAVAAGETAAAAAALGVAAVVARARGGPFTTKARVAARASGLCSRCSIKGRLRLLRTFGLDCRG